MKYLKTLLYVVLTVILFSTSHASSVLSTSDITSVVHHSVPEKKVKKQTLQKKEKITKKQLFKKVLGSGMSSLLAILLCILISPLCFLWVGLYTGWDGIAWLITLLLTLLFILPGIIYAIIVILSN